MHVVANSQQQPPPITAKAVVVLVGFAAVIGQIVLMRELIVLFNGNELSVGVMLAAWLVWTATGSYLTSRIVSRFRNIRNAIAVVECLCGLALLLAVWALYSARSLFQTVPGELLGPGPMLLVSLAGLSGFCILSGSLFVLAVRLYQQACFASERLAASNAYLLETAGSALGGILTSILLLRFFESFQIAMIVALLNLSVAASLIFRMRRGQVAAMTLAGVALATPLLAFFAPFLQQSAQRSLWKGFRILGSLDSVYGQLTIIEAAGMRSIYDSGSIVANVPDQAAAEESVHYALLEHPHPARVLLIGGGVNGSIVEALKHPALQRLDYVELDPALITLFRRYFPAESERSFSDPRVRAHYVDGRVYLKTVKEAFDVIILSVPDPQTAQLNRFYTAEFFRSARDHLAPGGVLALQLQSSEDFISPRLAEFLRSIQRTLLAVFPHVVFIPGGTIHFFATSQPGVLTEDPQVLLSRIRNRNLKTHYVSQYFLPYRMMPDRMEQVRQLLQARPHTPVNRDFRPVAYYFGNVLWSAQFKSAYARILESAAQTPFRLLVIAVAMPSLLLLIFLAWLAPPPLRTRAVALWCVGATGYTLMTLQILLLLAFQSVYGYVYHELSMLIGMFMAGIAVGSWLGIIRFRRGTRVLPLRAAALTELLLAISAALLLLMVSLLARSSGVGSAPWIVQTVFASLALLSGMPGGYQFPIASEIYIRGSKKETGAGTLYALDLAGGCCGALLLSGFLIPVFGFWNTAWLTAVVGLAPALLAARASFESEANSA